MAMSALLHDVSADGLFLFGYGSPCRAICARQGLFYFPGECPGCPGSLRNREPYRRDFLSVMSLCQRSVAPWNSTGRIMMRRSQQFREFRRIRRCATCRPRDLNRGSDTDLLR